MRKIFVCTLALVMVSSAAFSVDFSPTLLRISAPEVVQYSFDGSEVDIPLTVSGTPALALLCVFTKGKANEIIDIQNGFLGWHYVNKIDTCMYVSRPYEFGPGNNTVVWDGKDADGGVVPPGDYTYYVFAYDSQSPKQKVMYFSKAFYPYLGVNIEEFGEDGQPLAQPFFHKYNTKWVIGNDPVDSTLVETTSVNFPEGWSLIRQSIFHPTDHSYFYIFSENTDSAIQRMEKYQWVPNGDAVLDTEWGEDLVFTNPTYGGSGPVTDREILIAGYYGQYENGDNVNMYAMDFDGSLIQEFDMSRFWTIISDWEAGAQSAGGVRTIDIRHGIAYCNHYGSCLKGAVNPSAEDVDDFVVWVNGNGDYVNDHNWEEEANLAWVCCDFNVGPYTYTMPADDNGFSACNAYDVGAVTFGLMAPDGTGIGYFAFSGETAGWKKGTDFVDSGCAYDGIYCDNQAAGGTHTQEGGWQATEETIGCYYIAHDSIKGIITSGVGVEDEAPGAFSVAQNAPNPFNPSTTINFTLAEAGNVTVDIFNVAGQKVDTLVNEFMNAGNHSLVWDASEFSAGVYFYTVSARDFSKTLKMTLLK